jgi:hypothetical protein
MSLYKHIPFASGNPAYPATGHHYISRDDPAQQWDVTFYPRGQGDGDPVPLVIIRVLTDYENNTWETRAKCHVADRKETT